MVRPRRVGPDLPSGLRFPDRSVDLRGAVPQQMAAGPNIPIHPEPWVPEFGPGHFYYGPASTFRPNLQPRLGGDPRDRFRGEMDLWNEDARRGVIRLGVEKGLHPYEIMDRVLAAEDRIVYEEGEWAGLPPDEALTRLDETKTIFHEILDEIKAEDRQRAEEGLPPRYRTPQRAFPEWYQVPSGSTPEDVAANALRYYEMDVESNKAAIKEGDLSVPPEVQQAGRDKSWIELGMDAVPLEKPDPGGFIPPVVSERPGGFIPPVMPNAGPGGFTAHPPQSNILPGAPIRPPQAPTILTSGAVPNFQGPQAHMATGTPPGRVPGFRPGNEPQGSPQGGPGHRGRPPGGQSGPEGPRHPSNPNWYPGGTDWAKGPPGYDPAEWVTDEFGNWIDPDTGEIPPASVGSGNVPASDEGVAQLINALSNIMAMSGDLEGQQELPWGRRPQGLAGVQGARDVLGGAVPWTPSPDVVRPPVGGEPPPLPPPEPGQEWEDPDDVMNPESRMDWGYFAETAASRAGQPEQGYFGGLGSAAGSAWNAVNSLSTEDKLAIALAALAAVAAGTGVGGPLAPPLLAGSAALAGQP